VQRRSQREYIIIEGFVKLCQEGIEHVQVFTGGTLFRVQREKKCRGETLIDLLKIL
jgi:hypothetical protein